MTSGPHLHATHQPRLKLKPKAPATGYVDGGWWPRSADLAAELPALVEVLAVRLGPIAQVAYSLDAWVTPPRRLQINGARVRLEGFHSQDAHVLHVVGMDRRRISLLVVPTDAAENTAHDALTTAAERGNADSPARILTAVGILSPAVSPVLSGSR
jgi:hypothetical protein